MNGIPFWGPTTYEDIRNLHTVKTEVLAIEKINDLLLSKGYNYKVTDFYTLFLALSDLDLLFLIDNNGSWLSWCSDIRFNYRDRFVFIPYYTFKTEPYDLKNLFKDMTQIDLFEENKINVKHSFELKTAIVDDRRTNHCLSTLLLYSFKNKVKYTLDIVNLPYLTAPTFSLQDLHTRYLSSTYIKSDIIDYGWNKYVRIDNKFKNNREHLVRLKLGLRAYSKNYLDINYADCRQYSFDDIKETLGLHEFTDEEPYWLRRYKFEAYLYCIFASNAKVLEEDYKVPLEALGVTLRYIDYKRNGKSLILKHYYKDNVSMRRKSYERYKGD